MQFDILVTKERQHSFYKDDGEGSKSLKIPRQTSLGSCLSQETQGAGVWR